MAKHAKETKAKSSPGFKEANVMRATANKLSDEQREDSMSFAMQVIYGKGKKTAHAVRR